MHGLRPGGLRRAAARHWRERLGHEGALEDGRVHLVRGGTAAPWVAAEHAEVDLGRKGPGLLADGDVLDPQGVEVQSDLLLRRAV